MTKEREDQRDFEYSREETIVELSTWSRGGGMDPVAVASSAVHWLERSTFNEEHADALLSPGDTLEGLRAWLADDTRWLPDGVAHAALAWLRRATPKAA